MVRNLTNTENPCKLFWTWSWYCLSFDLHADTQRIPEWIYKKLSDLSWRSLSLVSNFSQLPRWRHFGDIYSCACCGRSLRAVTHHLSAEWNERNDSEVGSLVPFLHRSYMRCLGNEGMEDLSCSCWLIQHKTTSVLISTRVCYWGFQHRWTKSAE